MRVLQGFGAELRGCDCKKEGLPFNIEPIPEDELDVAGKKKAARPRPVREAIASQTHTTSGVMEATAAKSSAEPLYRPLDRTKNEIRLLRILPSTQESSASVGLEAASDIVVCELEYESVAARCRLR